MKRVFKWIKYVLFSLIILTLTVLLFLLNSTQTIQWVADKYAPQYEFSYKNISGGLLTGLEVDALAYKNDKLLDSLKVGWNPVSILYNRISLPHLEASGLNVKAIKKVLESFMSVESQEDNNSFIFSGSIAVGELKINVDPFEENGIGFEDISLNGRGVFYDGKGVDLDALFLSLETNVTTINLDGSIQDKDIRIRTLSIVDIDTLAFPAVIKKMIEMNLHEDIVEQVEPEVVEYKAGRDHLLPKRVQVDSFVMTVKPADHPHLKVNKGEVKASAIDIDIYGIMDHEPNTIQVASYDQILDTNLSRISIQAKLEDETITIESLSLRDIDTIALIKLFDSGENNQTVSDESTESNTAVEPLLPKFLYVKQLDSSIKAVAYGPLFVKSAEVNATKVRVNIVSFTAESGELDVRAVSNLVSLVQHGVIKDNQVKGRGDITAHQALFEIYGLPLKEELFTHIPFTLTADTKQIMADFDFKGKEILQRKEGEFNIEALSLKNHITYGIPEAKLTVRNEGNLSIPYAKAIDIDNVLTLKDGVLDYKGKVASDELEGVDTNYSSVFKKLKISYEGDIKGVEAEIDSEGLKGKFVSADLKRGELRLLTKQPIALNKMMTLPAELNASKATVEVHVPLDLSSIMPLHANVEIRSDLSHSDVDIVYDKELKVSAKTIFPEDSLLRTFIPKLNLDALSPLESNLTVNNDSFHLDVRSKGLRSEVTLHRKNQDIEGKLFLGGAEFIFQGNVEKKLSLENSVSSLEGLLQKINTIYTFDVPPLDGDAKISLVLTEMKEAALMLKSHTLTYKPDSETEHILNDTMISLGYSDSNLTLNSYQTTFDTEKIFATKPSVISMVGESVKIDPLWINDTLKVTGTYNVVTKNGEILAHSDPFGFSHEMVKLESRMDIKANIQGGKTSVDGSVTIMGGEIYYDMDVKTFSFDSDIVNAKELKKKKSSEFMNDLTVAIKVDTEKPFIYKNKEADMKANADLVIQKSAQHTLNILGTVEILEGSSYRMEDKKFVFKKSLIIFTGDPKKPVLDMELVYRTVNTKIVIHISGSPANPDIIFSSVPYMSREKILSMIVFGTPANDQGLSEGEMLSLMDGRMASSILSGPGTEIFKSIFSKVGINIDALPFIGGSFDANQSEKALVSFFSTEKKPEIPQHEIEFKGEKHISEKELQKAMGVDTKSIWEFWKTDRPVIKDKLLPKLEQSLQNFYDSQGFYNAEFSIKTSKTDVIVSIDENDPVKIKDINVSSDYDISKLIIIKKGQIFRAKEFVTIKNSIIEKLLEEGYCSYDLDSKAYVDLDKHEVDIHFNLKKGGICTFGKVSIKGLQTIDDSVVLSRVRAREGERFNIKRINETYHAIYELEAFESVSVGDDRKIFNVVPIDVETTEVIQPWYLKGDLDYDTTMGIRLSGKLLRANFMGDAKQLSLGFAYSKIDKGVELSYFVPACFKVSDYYIDFTSKIGYRTFRYKGFRDQQTYGKAFFSYNNEKLNLNAGVSLENIDISLRNYTSPELIMPGNFSTMYPFMSFVYDSRDSKLDPKNGYYVGGKAEYGLDYKKDASSYLKYSLEGRAIHTFGDLTLAAVAKTGVIEQKQNEIPESKLFFAGGVNSNRAYGYKRIGVILSPKESTVVGGATMANLSLEANYPMSDDLYAAVFSDNTMLTKDEHDFGGDVLSSAGLGIRYITPIGPIKLDFGMNVEEHSQYAIHFQIGQSF